ncbi:MAG TPA: hypothetical protein VLS85_13575 [Hanamia sp.]|nr:hypothetical protein [Hanamia sp.]
MKGHKWHFVSRAEVCYGPDHKPTVLPDLVISANTVLLYCCDNCGKFKEKELKGCYPEIAADELIRY